jgi:mRNA interferase MazF
MNRGEIWWAEPQGSEPGSRRPVLIVQDDLLTRSRLQSVMVAPLTSNVSRARAMGNVLLQVGHSGLARDSVVLVCQVMTIDKDFLTELVGSVPRRVLASIDDGLRLALDL